MSQKQARRKIGDPVECRLCGGDGHVSPETAQNHGRPRGDTTCPACDGSGRHRWNPLCGERACMGLACCDACLKCRRHCGCGN